MNYFLFGQFKSNRKDAFQTVLLFALSLSHSALNHGQLYLMQSLSTRWAKEAYKLFFDQTCHLLIVNAMYSTQQLVHRLSLQLA